MKPKPDWIKPKPDWKKPKPDWDPACPCLAKMGVGQNGVEG